MSTTGQSLFMHLFFIVLITAIVTIAESPSSMREITTDGEITTEQRIALTGFQNVTEDESKRNAIGGNEESIELEDNKGVLGFMTDIVALFMNVGKVLGNVVQFFMLVFKYVFGLTIYALKAPYPWNLGIGLITLMWQTAVYWQLVKFIMRGQGT